jgi:hypothetical protein
LLTKLKPALGVLVAVGAMALTFSVLASGQHDRQIEGPKQVEAVVQKATPAKSQNEAEKLFRAMEKKVREAKSLKVVGDVVWFEADTRKMEKGAGTVRYAAGNKAAFVFSRQGDDGGPGFVVGATSDGKETVAGTSFPFVGPSRQPTKPYLNEMLGMSVARFGLFGIFGNRDETKDDADAARFDVDKIFSATEFKLRPKESNGGVETHVIEYSLSVLGADKCKVRLWINSKTMVPLKRHILDEEIMAVVAETYSEFTVNPKLDDAKLFDLNAKD